VFLARKHQVLSIKCTVETILNGNTLFCDARIGDEHRSFTGFHEDPIFSLRALGLIDTREEKPFIKVFLTQRALDWFDYYNANWLGKLRYWIGQLARDVALLGVGLVAFVLRFLVSGKGETTK
jgi:hypothetical protein